MTNNQQAEQQRQLEAYINQIVDNVHNAYGDILKKSGKELAIEKVRVSELTYVNENLRKQVEALESQVEALTGPKKEVREVKEK